MAGTVSLRVVFQMVNDLVCVCIPRKKSKKSLNVWEKALGVMERAKGQRQGGL